MNIKINESLDNTRRQRICMPIFTNFAKNAFRTGLYEAQDILVDCDNVDIIKLEPTKNFNFKKKWLMKFVLKDLTGKLTFLNPGLKQVRLKRDYDLFLLVCPWWKDVWYANAIIGWSDHCKTSICWIDDLWANSITNLRNWLPILRRFDHIILGINGTGQALSETIGRKCHEIPGGIDAIRFNPYPNSPDRVIDVYSIGRRNEKIHKSILKISEKKNIFYVYDTIHNGDSETLNYPEHRNMYANMAKRSRFFIMSPGKFNEYEETLGQIDLGSRIFEGTAAGAVLIGQTPDCDAFYKNFDWNNAIIEIKADGSDVAKVIKEYSSEPEMLKKISKRNSVEALLRHDWVYRWKIILGLAGLEPSNKMKAREKRLKELANLIKAQPDI